MNLFQTGQTKYFLSNCRSLTSDHETLETVSGIIIEFEGAFLEVRLQHCPNLKELLWTIKFKSNNPRKLS